jgi:hypothetical protein
MNLSALWPFTSRSQPVRNGVSGALPAGDQDRIRKYTRYLRAYLGYSIRSQVGTTEPVSFRKLRHNLNRPIVNLGAAFMASKPLKWTVDGDTKATPLGKAAFAIWDRSGGERALLENARTGAIYGDVVALATEDRRGRPRIEFVSADICFPTFAGSDLSRLVELDITWTEETRDGRRTERREFYTENGREVFLDGERVPDETQAWDAIPAAWIRNLGVKGFPFGFSDLDGVAELVEEYDHVAGKRTRTVDKYADPTMVFKGISRKDLSKDSNTMIFLPGSKDVETGVEYLEWKGNQPDFEAQLTRIRNDLSEISQVPAVAFGRQDSGFSNISGVAISLLFQPLTSKTADRWGGWCPELERLMALCLTRETRWTIEPEQVNCVHQSPLPEDMLQLVQAEAAATGAGFKSLESAMQRVGIEDPAAEAGKVEHDKRFEHLALLVKAGLPAPDAMRLCGFSEAEIGPVEAAQAAAEEQRAAQAQARLEAMQAGQGPPPEPPRVLAARG